ncbi:MAG TPA: methyl-accepting chemotaxis protein [Frateuria sp.]|uniref:methyl-accepting chemotaxis protein n=1 Tax=Frateuria sp. TaxID=2211372 RepID=UPI002DEC948E|nr:methyl-accepting chemotaxis protein [Frateuria sp.]
MLFRLNRFRIGVRLAALGTLLLVATAIVGVGGWAGLSKMYRVQGEATETATAYAQAADTARVAQVEFKKQVQEWKDLLLRGADPAAYAKYRGAFLEESARVHQDLQGLRARLHALGSNVAGVDEALATHSGLQQKYVEALQRFDAKDPQSAHVVDSLVKGIDRAPTAAIDGIVAQVQRDQAQAAKRINDGSLADYRLACWMLLAITVFATLTGAFVTVLLTRSITRPIGRALSLAEAVAAGDLSSTIEVEGEDETAQLLAALARMNRQLHDVVARIRNGADEIRSSTAQIAAGNADLSARTSEQAAALEETVSSMEEFTRNVLTNAEGARGAQQRAQVSLEAAGETRAAMDHAVKAMEQIGEVSRHISEITEVLDRLATQSHILALNATVEAARAGETGKGFNVVATEVRALAAQSKNAARDIRSLVEQSSLTVRTGADRIGGAGSSLRQLADSVEEVSRVVDAIALVSADQSADIDQVNHAIHKIDQVTQSNSALVEEAAAAAEAVRSRAQELAQSVAFFRLARNEEALQQAA